MGINQRRKAYRADITYATAKEAGFDFLRMNLSCDPDQLVHRSFNYVIVDEADSILIDEARVPLVIAGDQLTSETNPYRTAEVVEELQETTDWVTDENGRNVFLTERGFDRVEEAFECGNLHDEENYLLLTEVNQALHARVLNARNDEAEAEIISRAGALGAVTISTNMAGRGTDIRLGGAEEEEQEDRVIRGHHASL